MKNRIASIEIVFCGFTEPSDLTHLEQAQETLDKLCDSLKISCDNQILIDDYDGEMMAILTTEWVGSDADFDVDWEFNPSNISGFDFNRSSLSCI